MPEPGEAGFTIVELLIALVLLLVGIVALAGVVQASGKLNLVSERESVMSHVARNELERLQTLSYSQLALTATPGTSSSSTNPDYYVSSQSGNAYFQWDPSSSSKEQLAIDSANGRVSPSPSNWSSGNISGQLYDFVTYHTDGNCGSGCPSSQNYKRIVVEITQSSGGFPRKPLIVQTLVSDPNAAPQGYVVNGIQNPLQSSGTTCQTSSGSQSCSIGIDQGNANSLFLYDTPATQSYSSSPTADHTLHNTVATCAGGSCPTPDLMGSSAPAGTTLYNYSTDLGGPNGSSAAGLQYSGGRLLETSSGGCSNPPSSSSSSSNAQAEAWVTAPLSAATTLNGQGGVTLYLQSANGVAASATICLALWAYPNSLANLTSTPPTEITALSQAISSLPTSPSPVSFTFDFSGVSSSQRTLAANQRIGVEIWLASSSGANAAIAYDEADYSSEIQLNTS